MLIGEDPQQAHAQPRANPVHRRERLPTQAPAKLTRDFERMIGSLGRKINRSRKTLLSEDLAADFEEEDPNGEAS